MNNEPPRVMRDLEDFEKHTSFMTQETLARVKQAIADKRAGRWVCWVNYGSAKLCTKEELHTFCGTVN